MSDNVTANAASSSMKINGLIITALVLVLSIGIGTWFPDFGFGIATIGLLVGVVCLIFGALGGRGFALILLIASCVASGVNGARMKENDEKLLVSLRSTDPQAYLEKLKASKSANYPDEFRVLDPEGFAKKQAEITAEGEAIKEANRQKIAQIAADLKAIPESDIDTNAAKYNALVSLDPANKTYGDKLRFYRGKQNERHEMQTHPEQHMKMQFTWHKGGFDSVMLGTFTITNDAPMDMKDVAIFCTYSAESGTKVGTGEQTILKVFPAGKTITVEDFNMGFMNSQAQSVRCRISGAKRL